MSTFDIATIGCKVNTYESQAIAKIMLGAGYLRDNKNCDVVIINTCCVTKSGEAKSRQKINRLKRLNPTAIMIAVGCYIQVSSFDKIKELPVDIFLGNQDKYDILKYIAQHKLNQERISAINEISNQYPCTPINDYSEQTRAYVKISDGCNHFCSYCLIPFARGRLRSRNKEEIIEEIKQLIANGFKEVVLTGIDVGSYGLDIIEKDFRLEQLIKMILQETTLQRLRISSIELSSISFGLKELIVNDSRIAKHLHVPLQSGSNKILEKMNRKYQARDYLEIILPIAQAGISITTDIIVGFPSESDEDFFETVSIAKEVKFLKIHVFEYSQRPGTIAAKLDDQITSNLARIRSTTLQHISLSLSKELENEYLGKIVKVLIEEEKMDCYIGHSSEFLQIHIVSKQKLNKNSFYNVQITERDGNRLLGAIVEYSKIN